MLMAACSSFPSASGRLAATDPSLSSIDSLLWTQPDSAFVQLQAFAESREVDSLNDFNRHYFHLLLSELLYKNYCEQSNRSELLKAVDYYDSIVVKGGNRVHPDLVFLDARIHYINGVGYYEMDSVVPACEQYLKAMEIMEDHFSEKELVGKKAFFMTKTFSRLGMLYFGQYMMELSVICYENAYYYCSIAPSSLLSGSNILYKLGQLNDMLGKTEKASTYYKQAFENIPDTNNLIYRNIVTNKALCDYQLGSGPEQPLAELKKIISEASDKNELLARFLIVGDIFYEERMYDSALTYLEPVLKNGEDILSQIQAADCLRNIYLVKGEEGKAISCAQFLADHTMTTYNNKVESSKTERLLKNYLDRKQAKAASQEKRHVLQIALIVAIPIVLLVAFFVNTLVKKRFEKERQSHRLIQSSLGGRLKHSNQNLRNLKENGKRPNTPIQHADSFVKEPVCQLILDRVKEGGFKSQMNCSCYKQYALDKEHLIALHEAADHHFDRFTERLAKAHPNLSKSDLDY